METPSAVTALGALAQESRLAVFRLLVQQGPKGLAAGAIARCLKVPSATMSFHLSQLSRAGLITSRRESRSIIYSASFDRMQALVDFLTENCCQGQADACGIESCEGDAAQDAALGETG